MGGGRFSLMYIVFVLLLSGIMSLMVIVSLFLFLNSFFVSVLLKVMMMLGGRSFSFCCWRFCFIALLHLKLSFVIFRFFLLAMIRIITLRFSVSSYGMSRMISSVSGFCGDCDCGSGGFCGMFSSRRFCWSR